MPILCNNMYNKVFFVHSSLHSHINIIIGCSVSIKSFHIKYITILHPSYMIIVYKTHSSNQ